MFTAAVKHISSLIAKCPQNKIVASARATAAADRDVFSVEEFAQIRVYAMAVIANRIVAGGF